MNAQHEGLRWSIASPSEIERTARELIRLRERFLAAPAAVPHAGRPMIVRSWERCRSMQVDAGKRNAPLFLTRDSELEELLDANEVLLRAARPVVERLAGHLADSGYVIVVGDSAGRILHIAGDRDIRRRLARVDFVPGGEWCEATAGTNAIGTCLQDRRPVQLMAAEHFCDGWTNLTCTAVPIRNPKDGSLAGVLDLTGDYRLIRSHLIALVTVNAREIEERLAYVDSQGRPPQFAPPEPGNDALDIVGGEVGASLDVGTTLKAVAEQAAALLHLDRAWAFVFDDESRGGVRFRCWKRKGQPAMTGEAAVDLFARSEAAAQLRERGQPIILDDVHESTLLPQPLAGEQRVRAVALIPLATARGITGILALPRPEPRRWRIDELRGAVALAAQAATAIENSLLFEALRKRNRHIEAINTIAELLGRLADPERHLEDILRSIVAVMRSDAGLIYLRNRNGGGVHLVALEGVNRSDVPAQRGNVPTPRAPTLIDAASPSEARFGAVLAKRYSSVLVAPLEHGSTSLGVIEVGTMRPPLQADDLNTLTAIALHISMALTNQRLVRSSSEVEALRQADALKSEFLATVSHDLRSPLTAIRASVEGLLDPRACRPFGEAEDLLHNISSQAMRLARLVDQLLDVSQIDAGRLRLDREWNELSGILNDAAAVITPLYGRHRVVYDIPPEAPILFVDRDRMVQVISNLLDNACKYGPADIPIRVEASWTEEEMVISVCDGGPGIAPGERENIFQRFYRGERKHGARSIGLGLAICRGIVDAHGGRIWVDAAGGGSAFRFSTPLAAEESDRLAAGASHG